MRMRYLLIAAATILPFAANAVKPTKTLKRVVLVSFLLNSAMMENLHFSSLGMMNHQQFLNK